MRCPICTKLIGDSAFDMSEHRKRMQGKCGEPNLARYVGSEPTPEIVKHERDRARTIERQIRTGNRKSPMKRLARANKR